MSESAEKMVAWSRRDTTGSRRRRRAPRITVRHYYLGSPVLVRSSLDRPLMLSAAARPASNVTKCPSHVRHKDGFTREICFDLRGLWPVGDLLSTQTTLCRNPLIYG